MDNLQYFYRLRDKDLVSHGAAIVEGHTLVRRLARIGKTPLSVLCASGQEDEYRRLFADRCPVQSLTYGEITEIIGYKFHRGVLAAVSRPEFGNWRSLNPASTGPLVLDSSHIQEGSNLGAIIRSSRAFGVTHVLIGPKTADPYSRKAIRASAGWVFSTGFYPYDGGISGLRELSERGYALLAAESRAAGAMPLEEYCAGDRAAAELLVLGHEFEGIDDSRRGAMDRLVEIPMEEGTDSLNVAVAAGILLYRLSRPLRSHG
jgi:tRNA G18 (ribose-2'-O)-methylase SpoU